MSCPNIENFCVAAGETFHPTIRWGTTTLASAAITAITQAAPAVVTAPGHGLPNGWPCAVVGAGGMTQINAQNYPPAGFDWQKGTVVDANTVQLNQVSSASYSPYTSGGFLVYSEPASLTGVTATLTIWDTQNENDTPLATLSSTSGSILIDTTLMTITPLLQTAGLPWNTGYYRLDVTDATGVVTQLATGTISIE